MKRTDQRMIKRGLFCMAFFLIYLGAVSLLNAQETPMMPPVMEGQKRPCLDCHRYPNVHTDAGVYASQVFCLECHAQKECTRTVDDQIVSLQVDQASMEKGRHQYVACIQCHTDVARSPHVSEIGPECLACHPVHGEGEDLHAPHLRVACQACHSVYKTVKLDQKSDQVRLAHVNDQGIPIGLTDHALQNVEDPEFCERCHHTKNKVGAPAAVLPSKGFICILCHHAPLRMGNPIFWIALALFVLGVFLTVRFWFRGSVQGESQSLHRKIALSSESIWGVIFSREFFQIIKAVIFDVILQRRLLQESVRRWAIHSLIFLPILFRLSLSVFTFFAYHISPESALATALIDKNNGFVAFVNDLTGLLILVGIVWALIQRVIIKPPHILSETRDNLALAIIGVLVILGFILEGARILMTGVPDHVSLYAFMGYPVSRLLALWDMDWTNGYVYLWYGHAVVGALLVAYLPFGKMRHIFNTPLNLVLNYKMK